VVRSLVYIISAKVNDLVGAQEILQLIANVLDTNQLIPGHPDTLLESYWKGRILTGLNHDEALRTIAAALGCSKSSDMPTSEPDGDNSALIRYGCTFENCNEFLPMKNADSEHYQFERWAVSSI